LLLFEVAARRALANARTCRYYRKPRFLAADLVLGSWNALSNPYRAHSDFRRSRGEDPYTYGETPIPALAKIARRVGLNSSDHCLELGCGPGRTAFWLASVMGCRVSAIDQVPAFIERGQAVARWSGLGDRLHFEQGDFLEREIPSDATFVYLCGSCLPKESIEKLAKRLTDLPSGTRLASVSYPLSEYSQEFALRDEFEAGFLWGSATVYCCQRV
jgi:SAM-dependent methyltransferase